MILCFRRVFSIINEIGKSTILFLLIKYFTIINLKSSRNVPLLASVHVALFWVSFVFDFWFSLMQIFFSFIFDWSEVAWTYQRILCHLFEFIFNFREVQKLTPISYFLNTFCNFQTTSIVCALFASSIDALLWDCFQIIF